MPRQSRLDRLVKRRCSWNAVLSWAVVNLMCLWPRRCRMAATPNGSRLTRQASMPLSSFTGQQTYSFNRPPQPAIGNAPGGSAGNGGQTGSRPSIARSATSAKETILTWVQQQVNHYNVSSPKTAWTVQWCMYNSKEECENGCRSTEDPRIVEKTCNN